MMVSEKLLDCLERAGASGLSPVELARELYGGSGYLEQGRVAQMIGNLRRKGYTIHTAVLFDGRHRVGKYVLVSEWRKN